jgi:hypothetical protein
MRLWDRQAPSNSTREWGQSSWIMGCLWETETGIWWRLFQAEGPLNSVLIWITLSSPFNPSRRSKFVKVWLVQNTPTHLPSHASTSSDPVTTYDWIKSWSVVHSAVQTKKKYTEANEISDTRWNPSYHASTPQHATLHSPPAVHNILLTRTFIVTTKWNLTLATNSLVRLI